MIDRDTQAEYRHTCCVLDSRLVCTDLADMETCSCQYDMLPVGGPACLQMHDQVPGRSHQVNTASWVEHGNDERCWIVERNRCSHPSCLFSSNSDVVSETIQQHTSKMVKDIGSHGRGRHRCCYAASRVVAELDVPSRRAPRNILLYESQQSATAVQGGDFAETTSVFTKTRQHSWKPQLFSACLNLPPAKKTQVADTSHTYRHYYSQLFNDSYSQVTYAKPCLSLVMIPLLWISLANLALVDALIRAFRCCVASSPAIIKRAGVQMCHVAGALAPLSQMQSPALGLQNKLVGRRNVFGRGLAASAIAVLLLLHLIPVADAQQPGFGIR